MIYDTITKTTVKTFVHILKMPFSKRYSLKYSVFRHVKTQLINPLKLAARIIFRHDFLRDLIKFCPIYLTSVKWEIKSHAKCNFIMDTT